MQRHTCTANKPDLWIWSWRLDLTGAKPSISSKKMMEGRIWYAWKEPSKNLLTPDTCTGITFLIFNIKADEFSLPGQTADVTASQILQPTCWGSQLLSSWRTKPFCRPDCTHWLKLWLQVFYRCPEDHRRGSPWKTRQNQSDAWSRSKTQDTKQPKSEKVCSRKNTFTATSGRDQKKTGTIYEIFWFQDVSNFIIYWNYSKKINMFV